MILLRIAKKISNVLYLLDDTYNALNERVDKRLRNSGIVFLLHYYKIGRCFIRGHYRFKASKITLP